MTLIRLIILALAIWIIFTMVRNYRARNNTLKKPQASRHIDSIVPCAQCDTHIPEKETIKQDGVSFCSAECAKAHQQQNH